MVPVVKAALNEAKVQPKDLDCIAVTAGPGLAGALLVGLNCAKSLAYAWDKPLLGINHLEGHIYANWLEIEKPPELPAVVLIVSGGHSELVLARGYGDYTLFGRTRDDAAGEAFDKAARVLGLGFPGGPAIERSAREAGPKPPRLPRAWLGDSNDFSFSGLKTAVARVAEESDAPVPDIAAGFQTAVVDVLTRKAVRVAELTGASSTTRRTAARPGPPLRRWPTRPASRNRPAGSRSVRAGSRRSTVNCCWPPGYSLIRISTAQTMAAPRGPTRRRPPRSKAVSRWSPPPAGLSSALPTARLRPRTAARPGIPLPPITPRRRRFRLWLPSAMRLSATPRYAARSSVRRTVALTGPKSSRRELNSRAQEWRRPIYRAIARTASGRMQMRDILKVLCPHRV